MPASSQVRVYIGGSRGTSFTLKKDLLAEKSRVLCNWFKENPDATDLSLNHIHTTPEIFRLVARFCCGHQVNFTPENIIPISCLALSLDMSNSHSPNNLSEQALCFFRKKIITRWNESLRALNAMENQIEPKHGQLLIGKCTDSIVNIALADPILLGEPVNDDCADDDHEGEDEDSEENDMVEEEEEYYLNLTTLHLKFYEPVILKMVQSKMDSNNIASNLYQYAKRWVFVEPKDYAENTSSEGVGSCTYSSEDVFCSYARKTIIEAIERLLPHDQSILPCSSLSKMLQNARMLKANLICTDAFEVRIGRQLDLATMSDLLIATQGCSKENKYDTECVRRILKHFHTSLTMKDQSKLAIVVELVKDYLLEAANDINLTKESFLSLAEMLIAESEETEGSSDGIYRAIDIYLNKRRDLKKSEREEICAVLDCNKMSTKVREEAARNVQLPVRTLVKVLFAEQLKLREIIPEEVVLQTSKNTKQKSNSAGDDTINVEEVKIQLEKGRFRVMELEKECLMLRKELENKKKECSLLLELRELQLPNEEKGSSKEENEDLIVYLGT